MLQGLPMVWVIVNVLLNSAFTMCLSFRQELKGSQIVCHVTLINSTLYQRRNLFKRILVIVYCHHNIQNVWCPYTWMDGLKYSSYRTHPVLLLWNHVVGIELLFSLFLFDCQQVVRYLPLQDNQVSQCAILLLYSCAHGH
jgi:hypothetical protein